MRPFTNFALEFTKKFLISVYSGIGAVSTLLQYLPLPSALHKMIPYLIAGLFLASAYRAGWVLHQKREEQIAVERAELVSENNRLRSDLEKQCKKPFDEDHRHIVEEKLAALTTRERDLLRFLLHRGATESFDVRQSWLGENYDTDNFLNVLKMAGLVTVKNQETLNAARVLAIWQVNPSHVAPLEDLLFPRDEGDTKPYFTF